VFWSKKEEECSKGSKKLFEEFWKCQFVFIGLSKANKSSKLK